MVNKWWFLPISFLVTTPLVWVRKMERFAPVYFTGNILIFLTLLSIITYASIHALRDSGFTTEGFLAVNFALWPDAIGFSVYAFDCIGIILPIMDMSENKKQYFTILASVVGFACFLYISFSEYCLFSYGGYTVDNPHGLIEPLIIDSLP
jgi:hypothetical protein